MLQMYFKLIISILSISKIMVTRGRSILMSSEIQLRNFEVFIISSETEILKVMVLILVQVLVLVRVAMRWYQEEPEEERLHHVSPDHPQQGNHQQQSTKPKDKKLC